MYSFLFQFMCFCWVPIIRLCTRTRKSRPTENNDNKYRKYINKCWTFPGRISYIFELPTLLEKKHSQQPLVIGKLFITKMHTWNTVNIEQSLTIDNASNILVHEEDNCFSARTNNGHIFKFNQINKHDNFINHNTQLYIDRVIDTTNNMKAK